MNNLADEVLNCISMVDSSDFVQHFSKSKGVMPNFICYTENQTNDLNFFLSQKSQHPVGVDRTFNLGRFFVTALVYKNLRVVRADDPAEHPLFIGPMLIHRDATFKAYYYFFSMVKASLQHSIGSFDIRLGKDMLIGSDEEGASPCKCNRRNISWIASIPLLKAFKRRNTELYANEGGSSTKR